MLKKTTRTRLKHQILTLNWVISLSYTSLRSLEEKGKITPRADVMPSQKRKKTATSMNSINKICNEYMRNYWKINASPEKNAKHSEYKRNYRKANAFPEKKKKPDQCQKVYRTNASVDFSIRKFHEVVNQVPVYVCSCCD